MLQHIIPFTKRKCKECGALIGEDKKSQAIFCSKKCSSKFYFREYRKKNKEKILARNREWYYNNKDKARAYAKAYVKLSQEEKRQEREKHPVLCIWCEKPITDINRKKYCSSACNYEYAKEAKRIWITTTEEGKAYNTKRCREYYQKHKKVQLARLHEYREKNAEAFKEYHKKYYQENKERLNKEHKKYYRKAK